MPTIKVVKLYQEQPVYDPTVIIHAVLEINSQLKLFHWQTFSYAQHKALDKIGKSLSNTFDKLVETLLGRYRNFEYRPISIQLEPYSNENLIVKIEQYIKLFSQNQCPIINKQDSDVQNIIEEILADLNQLKYLLTLE
jgi:DNA-binding ferritin-like protein